MARHFPAEWAPQGAVMLIWPHDRTDWAPRLEQAEAAFAAFALAVTQFEPIVVVCRDDDVRRRALDRLSDIGCSRAAIATVLIDTNDTWARDIAPLAVRDDGRPILLDTGFNGWGAKFEHGLDAAFGAALVDSAGFATLGYERCDLVLEGGAVESDGRGTVLLNRPTVIDPRRNPGIDAAAAEACLRDRLGAHRVLWLDVPPLPGDDTDGHIDTLARFCDERTIAHAAPHSPEDPAAPMLITLEEQLRELRTEAGEPYRLVPLPGPAPIATDAGAPCPASYANFLVVNGGVLVPSYADAADGPATERLQAAFPGRRALPVPARTFVTQAGALHCLSMQLPEGAFEDLALT